MTGVLTDYTVIYRSTMQTWISKNNFIRACVKLFSVDELAVVSVHTTIETPLRAKIKISMIWYANIDDTLTVTLSSALHITIKCPYSICQIFNTPWHTIVTSSHTKEGCIRDPWSHYTRLYSFAISIYETRCGISKTSVWISWESTTFYAELHVTTMIANPWKIIFEQSKLTRSECIIIDTWKLHTE